MADIVFSNAADTNLKDINEANITDPGAAATTFTGVIGTSLLIDVEHGTSAISDGEVTLTGADAQTSYVAVKGAAGELGLYTVPQI